MKRNETPDLPPGSYGPGGASDQAVFVKPKNRKRRKWTIVTLTAVATLGIAAIAPTAFADKLGLDLGVGNTVTDKVQELIVDDALPSVIDVGDSIDVEEHLSYADFADGVSTLEFTKDGASYTKVHFEKLLLRSGDSLTISNRAGSEVHTYTSTLIDDWGTSVTGDTAIVELSVNGTPADSPALGAVVDKVAYGYSQDVIDRIMSDKSSAARTPESNCERNDRKPGECYRDQYPDVLAHTEPVAKLLIEGTVLCTAFKVSESNRLLTNNHCFDQSWQAQRTEVWFGYDCKSCSNTAGTEPVKVKGERVLKTNKNLDYTLFTVDRPEAISSFGMLELSDEKPKRDEQIYIPQHPGGRPMEIAMESTPDGGACIISAVNYDGYIAGSDVAYYCDTEFGSSGSPVLSRATHKVIALHHFGGCPNSGVSAYLILPEIESFL